ncbi:hypothetical protein FDECE_12049 [Fusarium decemcellulare]|nr:hypothetical protein FDECE_12049 [Fusarium decemcellulare]
MPERVISDELIDKLTCTEELNIGSMIRGLPLPPKTSSIRRSPTNSSMGRIDTLPPELLLLMLNLLDFRSLSRLSQASFKAKATVGSLPAYREMVEHAPDVLTALGRTRLLEYHPAALLRQTLRTDHVMFHVSRRKKYRLVSVKQAKQLAIEVHGSAENVASLMPTAFSPTMPEREFWTFKQFHEAPLEPPACDLSRKPGKSNIVEDGYGGMASIRMPSLSGTSADRGRLCKGCHFVDKLQSKGALPTAVLRRLVPEGVDPRHPLLALITRLHSREGFLEHIKTCYGAYQLLAEWGEQRMG